MESGSLSTMSFYFEDFAEQAHMTGISVPLIRDKKAHRTKKNRNAYKQDKIKQDKIKQNNR